jgi:hypothetical protein
VYLPDQKSPVFIFLLSAAKSAKPMCFLFFMLQIQHLYRYKQQYSNILCAFLPCNGLSLSKNQPI